MNSRRNPGRVPSSPVRKHTSSSLTAQTSTCSFALARLYSLDYYCTHGSTRPPPPSYKVGVAGIFTAARHPSRSRGAPSPLSVEETIYLISASIELPFAPEVAVNGQVQANLWPASSLRRRQHHRSSRFQACTRSTVFLFLFLLRRVESCTVLLCL